MGFLMDLTLVSLYHPPPRQKGSGLLLPGTGMNERVEKIRNDFGFFTCWCQKNCLENLLLR